MLKRITRAIILIGSSLLLNLQFSYAMSPEPPKFSPDQIFSVVTGDWNKDDVSDAVWILNRNDGEQFDVLFHLSDEYGRLKLHTYVPDMVWGASVMFGQEPWVSVRDNGSIIIGSQNSAIGRNRWEQKLTVIFKDQQFVVAGFTYSYYDTLDLNANGECDLNLLTGKGIIDGKAEKFDRNIQSVIGFSDTSDTIIDLCIR